MLLARRSLREFPEEVAFHSQQAAEKALKAVLIKKTGELIKTHELVFLARKVGAPAHLVDDCKDLNELFASTRYPGMEDVTTAYTPQQALDAARRVVFWSKKQI